jgi:hypothetical protein
MRSWQVRGEDMEAIIFTAVEPLSTLSNEASKTNRSLKKKKKKKKKQRRITVGY